jgi:DNA-binding NarL/FixJ family response regulator
MSTKKLQVAIVSDNPLVVQGLKRKLCGCMGQLLEVSAFYETRSLLRAAAAADVIVADYMITGVSSNEALSAARKANPSVQVVMHSSCQEVMDAIESLIHCRVMHPPVFPVFKYSQYANYKL